MRALLIAIAVFFLTSALPAETVMEKHYRVYRGDGSAATMDDITAAVRGVDVTFLGEVHDDPTGHQLELEVLTRCGSPHMALGLEMFERDVQPVVDEYLDGLINEDNFRSSARAWPNYKTDYRPLVEYARDHKMLVIASNAPRRYVNRVSRLGGDSLSALPVSALAWLAPVPYAPGSAEYEKKFRAEMSEHDAPPPQKPEKKSDGQSSSGEKPGPPMPKLNIDFAFSAQSLWDATMAYSIADYLTRHPGASVVHVNGAFHSAEHLGVVQQLSRYRPGVRALVVTMTPAAAPFAFDKKSMQDQGDFVIVTDEAAIKESKSAPPAK